MGNKTAEVEAALLPKQRYKSDGTIPLVKKRPSMLASTLMTFIKILISLAIMLSLDQRWLNCWTTSNTAYQCTQDCHISTFCNVPCWVGGSGTVQKCSSDYSDECSTIDEGSYACQEGEYCITTTNSVCQCNNWFYYSFSVVAINIFSYLLQLFFIYFTGSDPIQIQLHQIEESNFPWLLNPWSCWIGVFDADYLIAAIMLQLEYANALPCSPGNLPLLLLSIFFKEIYKINIYFFLQSWTEEGKSYYEMFSNLVRVTLFFKHFVVIAAQLFIFIFSCFTLFIPFYYTWNSKKELDKIRLAKLLPL